MDDLKECREAFEKYYSDNWESPRAIARCGDSYKLAQACTEWRAWQECWKVRAVPQASAHTIEDDFQHFLSYSNLSFEPEEVKEKLLRAYEANWVAGPQDSAELDALLERERRDAQSLASLLVKERRRFEFLHSTNCDAEGWEWGVARIRVNEYGECEYLWGVADHSDIDAAIAAWNRRAVPQANAEQDAITDTQRMDFQQANPRMYFNVDKRGKYWRFGHFSNYPQDEYPSAREAIDAAIRAASKTTPSSGEGGNADQA